MIKMEMTYHASVERLDRLAACVEYLGMSQFVYEAPDPKYPGTIKCLTATGITVIKSSTSNTLITGWMASPREVAAMYKGNAPKKLFARVIKNNEKFAFLATM